MDSNLSAFFCIPDESIKTVIDDLKVILELSLPRDHPSCQRNFPVRNVEGGSMLSFKKSTIYCLQCVFKRGSMNVAKNVILS